MSRVATPASGLFPKTLLSPRDAVVINNGSAFRLRIAAEGDVFRLFSLTLDEPHSNGRRGANGAALLGLGGTKVIEIAGGPEIFTRLVELPQMPRREAVETLRHTQADSAPFPLRDAVMDVWITGRTPQGGMRVFMAAMSAEKAQTRRKAANASRPRPHALTSPVAAIRALVLHSRRLDKSDPLFFAVLEKDFTGLYILRNGVPLFTREAPFGLPAGSPGRDAGDPSGAALKRLAVEIERTMDYFRRSGAEDVRGAYLVGSGAMTENLDRYLTDFTGTPFTVYDPFEDFISTGGGSSVPGPEAAIAVGIAIDGGETINLLGASPWKRSLGALNRWPYWLVAAAAAVFIFFARQGMESAISSVETQTAALEARAGAMRERLAERESLHDRLRSIRGNISRLETELAGYPALRGSGIDWAVFFNGVAGAMPKNLALTRLSLDVAESGILEVEGLARGPANERMRAIAELSENLEDLPAVGSVLLRRLERYENGNGDFSVFRMKAALKQSKSKGAKSQKKESR
ncbi:MAG: hypothetical protein ACNS63_08295 [Candidatus Nitrospinota bacterium M3_3B_026]